MVREAVGAGRFAGKTALVTGGASGLGKATARRLASEGANVVITDLQDELGQATAREFGLTYLRQDVTSDEQWPATMREVEDRFGHLDILVNNAGIAGALDAVTPENTRFEDWKKTLAVNLDGVFLGCHAGIAAMRKAGGGSIVNISSIAAMMATADSTAYGASKAGVRHLTKSVAQHCAQQRLNIRCNSVHPGEIRTPLWDGYARQAAASRGVPFDVVIAESRAAVPLGDFPLPEDVAAAVAFLCSDDARMITGSEVLVDGGFIHCR